MFTFLPGAFSFFITSLFVIAWVTYFAGWGGLGLWFMLGEKSQTLRDAGLFLIAVGTLLLFGSTIIVLNWGGI